MENETREIVRASAAYRSLQGVEKYLSQCSLEKSLRELIKLRVSQMNGCAFCIDMHWKDARAGGESEARLYGLPAWRESRLYSNRERAGLFIAEELTLIAHRPLTDEVHALAAQLFSPQEYAELLWAIAAINAWNRLNVALKTEPGAYVPPALDH